MKTELQVVNKLIDVIVGKINSYLTEDTEHSYLLERIDYKNTEMNYPDIDNMRKNTMFYILPDYEEIIDSELVMGSDIANMDIKVYIFCKGAKNENLIKKVFGYYNALYALIRTNENLDNFVEFTKITNMDFYPAVSANGSITGIETTLNIQWINWTNGEV